MSLALSETPLTDSYFLVGGGVPLVPADELTVRDAAQNRPRKVIPTDRIER